MKKFFLILTSLIYTSTLLAQEPADALRFSWTVPGGTARQQAVGGAMGSLGGDITSAFTNPAGLANYRTGDFILSPVLQMGNTKSTYLDRTESANRKKLLWGTTGFIVGGFNRESNTKNTAFGIAYNRTADFNSNILYRGFNKQSSFSQKYVEELNNSGIRDASVGTDFPFGSSLAFNTFWIDTVKNNSGQVTGFKTNTPPGMGLIQQQVFKSSGGIDEFAVGGAVNFNNKFMLGGTLGIGLLHYQRETGFTEADTSESATNGFNYGLFEDRLTTKGIGFGLRIGLIYKPQEQWRLGLAFHTPTVFGLTDNYEASITTDMENGEGVVTDYSIDYTSGPSLLKYSFITPYRAMGSVSYVLGTNEDVSQQKGFVTADVEYVNYKVPSYQENTDYYYESSTSEYLKSLNRAIDNAYKGAFNIRGGGELKFTTFMIRGGLAYYGNPYKNIHGEKGSKLNVSGGMGYRNKGFFMDVTYVHTIQKDVHFPYRLESAPYFGANIKSNTGSLLATVGFKF